MPDARRRGATAYSTHPPTQAVRNRLARLSPRTRASSLSRNREYNAIWQSCDRIAQKPEFRRASMPRRRSMMIEAVEAILNKRRKNGSVMCGINYEAMIERQLLKCKDQAARTADAAGDDATVRRPMHNLQGIALDAGDAAADMDLDDMGEGEEEEEEEKMDDGDDDDGSAEDASTKDDEDDDDDGDNEDAHKDKKPHVLPSLQREAPLSEAAPTRRKVRAHKPARTSSAHDPGLITTMRTMQSDIQSLLSNNKHNQNHNHHHHSSSSSSHLPWSQDPSHNDPRLSSRSSYHFPPNLSHPHPRHLPHDHDHDHDHHFEAPSPKRLTLREEVTSHSAALAAATRRIDALSRDSAATRFALEDLHDRVSAILHGAAGHQPPPPSLLDHDSRLPPPPPRHRLSHGFGHAPRDFGVDAAAMHDSPRETSNATATAPHYAYRPLSSQDHLYTTSNPLPSDPRHPGTPLTMADSFAEQKYPPHHLLHPDHHQQHHEHHPYHHLDPRHPRHPHNHHPQRAPYPPEMSHHLAAAPPTQPPPPPPSTPASNRPRQPEQQQPLVPATANTAAAAAAAQKDERPTDQSPSSPRRPAAPGPLGSGIAGKEPGNESEDPW